MTEVKTFNLRLGKDTHAAIKQAAWWQQKAMHAWIVEAIQAKLEAEQGQQQPKQKGGEKHV